MAYAPEHEKELPNRSHRRRMGSNRAPRSGARGARTTEDPRPAQDPRRRFYILKSGYSWRLLPREFPPWETVYWRFGRWRMDGTFERLNAALRERLRLRSGRDPLPSAGIADFQRLRPPGSAASRGDTTVTRRFGAGSGTWWWIRKA
jgi:transposase